MDIKDSDGHDKYIVTKDNPYYPTVTYCNSLAEAAILRDEMTKDNFDDIGEHECNVTIAKVIETITKRSDY